MEMKRVVKNVVALSSAAMFLGSTVLGALDLSNYPAPFTENGDFDGLIVVGADAATADVIGAIDIAASLQADTVEEKEFDYEGSVSVGANAENGFLAVSATKHINPFNEDAFAVKNKFDRRNWEVLADRDLIDESTNDEVRYTQELDFDASGFVFKFGRPDTRDFDEPVVYLDTKTSSPTYTYNVEFDTAIDLDDYDDNEEVVLFGKTYTIDPATYTSSSDIVFNGGAEEITVSVGESQTIEGLNIELVSANTDSSPAEVNLKINGKTYSSKSKGDRITVDDEEIYLKEVATATIPEPTAYIVVSVGSDKLEIKKGSSAWDGSTSRDVYLDGEKVDGVTAVANDPTALDKIEFTFTPKSFEDEVEYLVEGERFEDPVFGLEVLFEGLSPALDAEDKTESAVYVSGDFVYLDTVNSNGDAVEFKVYEENGATTIDYAENFGLTTIDLAEDARFLLMDGDSTDVHETRLFEVVDIYEDSNTIEKVDLLDMVSGTEYTFTTFDEVFDEPYTYVNVDEANDKVHFAVKDDNTADQDGSDEYDLTANVAQGDTEYFIYDDGDDNYIVSVARTVGDVYTATVLDDASTAVVTDGDSSVDSSVIITGLTFEESTDADATADDDVLFSLSTGDLYEASDAAIDYVMTEGGHTYTIGAPSGANADIVYDEEAYANIVDEVPAEAKYTVTAEVDASRDVTITGAATTNFETEVSDEEGDYEYTISDLGTYVREDKDDSLRIDMWLPQIEQKALVAVGRDVEVSTSGSATGGTFEYEEVNKIGTGIAMLDSEVTSVAGKNIIAVGGYAANSVAAQFMSAEDLPEAFGEGQALVKLAENGDNVALVVAGYTADDTRLASQVLANYEDYDLSGETVVISGSSLSNVDVVTE